jgi:hypothetical protein
MKTIHLPNRDKIINELTRRYEECLHKAEKGIHDDEEAQQFISLLAHYVYYVKNNPLTTRSIKDLFSHQEIIAGDKVLIEKADTIIEEMKQDRNKIVRYARRKGVNIPTYEFIDGARQLSPIEGLSFHLHFLDQFLNLPSNQQQVGEVPRRIGELTSINLDVQSLGGNSKAMEHMRKRYIEVSNQYAKDLKLQGVYLDYLRVDDYKALQTIWNEVYQEGDRDERIIFHLMYGDLFEKGRRFVQGQQREADEFVSKNITHLQRVHNYITDKVEDVPISERFLRWTVEHLGPTFVSLILLFILWIILNWFGIKISAQRLKSLTGF